MHLDQPQAASTARGLAGLVAAVLDRRLRPDGDRPVAVAFSGGGDSLALLLASDVWARRMGRMLLVLTVDHGLRPESVDWTRSCAAVASRLNRPFRALCWEGQKPSAGLPAAARKARHRLLADAAREAGARVILMGHTADDILEARRMRQDGSTTPEPREWSPSPVWPQGRGLFLLRPLLDARRAEIRTWLAQGGERWIDDPTNDDPTYARPRARREIARGAAPAPAGRDGAPARDLALAAHPDAGGGFELSRATLRAADPIGAQRFVSAACLCSAGTDRLPPAARTQSLTQRLLGTEAFAASLAGARIEADATHIRFLREPGEAARGGLRPACLQAGESAVWDGRFEITATHEVQVRAAAGLAGALSSAEQAVLRSLAPRARAAYPAQVADDGVVTLPAVRVLTADRLLAACGAVDREPDWSA